MTDNVIHALFPNAARDPDVVLKEAVGIYDEVITLGYDKNGQLEARASLNLDHAEINWILDQFKLRLTRGDYDATD